MTPAKAFVLAIAAACAATAVPAHAQVDARALAQASEERERAMAQQMQAERQRRIERARENCARNRGSDCDTLEGLQEWLLLDRSRADAVLDRVYPQMDLGAPIQTSPGSRWPSSSTGSSGR